MKKIDIQISNELNITEFIKCISFISQKITGYKLNKDNIEIFVSDDVETEDLKEKIESAAEKYQRNPFKQNKIWELKGKRDYQVRVIENDSLFCRFENGMLGLNNQSVFLYDFFEKKFEKIALELGARKKRYPVLLNIDKYKRTGYLKNSPQYAMFCCDAVEEMGVLEKLNDKIGTDELREAVNIPQFALSPSACFHVYVEQENKVLDTNRIYTFTQNVFRNEGRLNYNDLGRLRDYHVREVVFIGDENFVEEARKKMMDKVTELVGNLNLFGEMVIASDPFVLPKMQKFKIMQLMDACKYELRLNCSEDKQLSAASFNLHGTAFTYPFNIGVKGVDRPVTGCVGFGLERWVIAFLSQYGFDSDCWPETVKKELKSYEGLK